MISTKSSAKHSSVDRQICVPAFRNSPDGFGITKLNDGTFVKVNEGIKQTLGYSEEELLGKTMVDLKIYSKPESEKLISILKANGKLLDYKVELNKKDGTRITALVYASLIKAENEDYMAFTVRNISEKKKALQELERQKLFIQRTIGPERKKNELVRYYEVIRSLIVNETINQGQVNQAFDLIVKNSADALGVSRVGIWLYNEEKTAIICKTLYERGKGFNYKEIKLRETDCPAYFEAIKQIRNLDIDDAQNNETSTPLSEIYLLPLGITSMLDVPIKVEGQTLGVICHEHVGEKRQWEIEEINFAASLSALLTKAFKAKKQIQIKNDLKKAKKELEEEKLLTHSLMGNIPGHIYFKDKENRFSRISQSFVTSYNANSTDEIPGKTNFDLYEEKIAKMLFNDEQEVFKIQKPILNKIVKNKNICGEEIWESQTKIPLFNPEGNISGTFDLTWDITDSMKNEELTKQTNDRLELATQFNEVGIWDWNVLEGTMVGNSVWEKIFGFKSNKKNANTWMHKIHPDDYDQVMQSLSAHMNGTKEQHQAEFRYMHPEKGIVWLKSTGKVVEYNEKGIPVHMQGTTIDISGIKLFEQRLKEAELELGKTNNELEHFTRMALQDLKDPMGKIRNYNNLLKEKYTSKLNDETEKYFDRVNSGVDHMDTLISDLHSLSKLTAKRKEFCNVDLNNLKNELKEQFKLKIEEEEAQLIIPDLPVVRGDAQQLALVFQNLIANALKFRRETSPIVEIKVENKVKTWIFEVKDNGVGFNPEYTHKVFGLFQHLHSLDEYEEEGTGLAICKNIIERHEGKIWAESEPGRGSTLYFTLPHI